MVSQCTRFIDNVSEVLVPYYVLLLACHYAFVSSVVSDPKSHFAEGLDSVVAVECHLQLVLVVLLVYVAASVVALGSVPAFQSPRYLL